MDLTSRPGPWRTKPAVLPEQVLAILSASARDRVPAKAIPTLPVIREGDRDTSLFRVAARQHGLGAGRDETLAICLALNQHKCQPPLRESQVLKVVASAFKDGGETRATYRQATCAFDIKHREPVRWVVNNLFPAGEWSVVFGDGGTFKTTIMLEVAGAVAGGYSAFGHRRFSTDAGAVLYVSEEDGAGMLRNRLRALARGHMRRVKKVLSNVHLLALEGFRFSDQGWRDHLRTEVRRLSPKLVVIDPLAGTFDGDENTLADYGPVVRFLRSLAAESGAGVVLVHHATKMRKGQRKLDRVRGHSSLNQGARAIHFVSLDGERIIVECVKQSRIQRPVAFALKLRVKTKTGNEALWSRARLRCAAPSSALERATQFILDQLAQRASPPSTTDLREAARGTGLPRPALTTALRLLREGGRVTFTEAARGKRLWALPQGSGNPGNEPS